MLLLHRLHRLRLSFSLSLWLGHAYFVTISLPLETGPTVRWLTSRDGWLVVAGRRDCGELGGLFIALVGGLLGVS